jgi:ribokinase
MAGRVIVVGSVNVDLVVRAPRLPSPGETVTGGSYERHHGGKGGNQAVASARLGRPTLFVAAIGDDDFGIDARAALVAEGVDVFGVEELPRQATGVAVILVGENGENLIAVASGANAELTPVFVRDRLARLGPLRGDVVLMCNEIPQETVREALRVARAAGATTVFNPAPAAGIERETIDLADIITPNRGELVTLLGATGPASVARGTAAITKAAGGLLAHGRTPGVRQAVIVTLGRLGAQLVHVDDSGKVVSEEVPAPEVEAIDTTGAGDAFNGALAVALAAGRPIGEACRWAVTAGALATTRVGAREGMPTAAALLATLGLPADAMAWHAAEAPEQGSSDPAAPHDTSEVEALVDRVLGSMGDQG